MFDNHPVAALNPFQLRRIIAVHHDAVRHTVANSENPAICSGYDRHAAGHVHHRPDPKIPSVMPVIGRISAERIIGQWARANVRHLLDEAIFPEIAIDGQRQL